MTAESSSVVIEGRGRPSPRPNTVESLVKSTLSLFTKSDWSRFNLVRPDRIRKALSLREEVERGFCQVSDVVTLAIDSSTTPFESLLRAVRAVDLYSHCADYYQSVLGTGPLEGFPSRLTQQQFWILSDTDLALCIGNLFSLSEKGLLEKVLKHFTATLLARAMRQSELPIEPSGFDRLRFLRFVFQGSTWIKWWSDSLHNAKKLKSTEFVRFAYNFYFVKSGSLPVSGSFVSAALTKHVDILTDPKVDPMDSPTTIPDLEDRVLDSIKRATNEIFGKTKRQTSAPRKYPSLGASFLTNRASGGAAGELFYQISGKRFLEDKIRLSSFPVLGGYLHPKPSVGTPFPVYYDQDSEDCEYFEDESLHRAVGASSSEEYINPLPLSDYWLGLIEEGLPFDHLYESILEDDEVEDLVPATVVPLLEAFKVRTITKGDLNHYHLARRWQTRIHGIMRRHLNFLLIGQPANADLLANTLFNDLGSELYNSGGFLVSGDYESATDCLHPFLSEYANECIGQALGIPLEELAVLKRCLTGHDLHYPSGSNFPQAWGQLMGSPTSFPILCLLNLAATRVAYEVRLDRSFNLCELPALVNGDDIGFISLDQRMYALWKEITAFCGLKFSLGKNYTHRRYLVINSELYRLTNGLRFKKVPILNYRLLLGGNRSSVSGIDLNPKDQWLSIQSLINSDDRLDTLLTDRLPSKIASKTIPEKVQYYLHACKRSWSDRRGLRAESYKRWYLTLPQRQGTFREQLIGGYGGKGLNEGLGWFRSVQIRKLLEFEIEFPSPKGLSQSNYLPRALGGLGLLPPPGHVFSVLDRAQFQVLFEQPELLVQMERAFVPGLLRSPINSRVSQVLADCERRMGLLPELVPISSWDEHLERHGEPEIYDLSVMHGFSNHAVALCDEDFQNSNLDFSLWRTERIKQVSNIFKTIKRRSVRMVSELRKGGEKAAQVFESFDSRILDQLSWLLRVAMPSIRLPS